jgi:phage tail sheath protein FI
MATPQLSPGVRIREVDLTVGRADNVNPTTGGIAAPFERGSIEVPTLIENEADLLNTFGEPYSTDSHYEYWMSASSYLAYGGNLRVVRTDDDDLKNANAGVGIASTTTLKIKSYDDYSENYSEATNFVYAAKDPGSWANGLKVCQIDDLADQRVGIATTNLGAIGARIGFGVTVGISTVLAGGGSTSVFSGYVKAIVTGVSTDSTNSNSTIDIKIISRVSTAGTETQITYAEGNETSAYVVGKTLTFMNSSGVGTDGGTGKGVGVLSVQTAVDWYDQQTLGLSNATVYWKTIAPKPVSNAYSLDRNGKNDAVHVVVVDDNGSITGNQATLLEKHLFLSKAKDAISSVNSPQRTYYKNYLAENSAYVFAGNNPSSAVDAFHGTIPAATGFSTNFTPYTVAAGTWGQNAQSITFSSVGNVTYSLVGGKNYSGTESLTSTGALTATLGKLSTAYDKFLDDSEVDIDFLIMGPGLGTKEESQAKANKLIAVADTRKDCIAVISPYRTSVVNITDTDTQTDNVIDFFSAITSSSYAVFDSGYKYMYDRFNDEFRYIPCNGDIAGLMARTTRDSFPWFSPAGQQRGVLLNAVKLAYNPTKAQRDLLYPRRINPVLNKPGIGVLLFGDKTGLGYASAFDRINVRRLFLYVEEALQRAADAQLFEFNDEITRANFVNIVEPFLRDIQSKRGLFDFLVICDETNNTPDIIDNNEFRADIFLKPTKSINFVELTFIATRTGVSFNEVAGRV